MEFGNKSCGQKRREVNVNVWHIEYEMETSFFDSRISHINFFARNFQCDFDSKSKNNTRAELLAKNHIRSTSTEEIVIISAGDKKRTLLINDYLY